jgi:serine/threonine protein kinase/WD40 repeat protein
MTHTQSGPDLLSDLAHEFAERYRRGERPALSEYTERYPDLADQIRDLFPALVVMEEFGSVAGQPPAAAGRAGPDGRQVPQQLGEYRILREVGRGGMGIVYEAVQESLGRHVALKVLPFPGLVGPTHRERFEREARTVARLHHSNIVPVFGSGSCGGVHYYAMQFIQGQGLDAVLNEVRRQRAETAPPGGQPLTVSLARGLLTGRLDESADAPTTPATGPEPPHSAVTPAGLLPGGSSGSDLTGPSEAQYFRGVARLGVQVAEALAYAHRQGVVHRDIKPSNLLLDAQGVVWVTDFGLVKDDSGDNLTRTGDIVGTARYMAPERFDGRGDGRGDVYALGATLYELLVLRPAFDDPRARLVERVLHEEPVPPRKIDPRVPRDLETVVLKAMAKEPGRRYPTADELADDLRRFLADRPIRARRSSHAERLWRWCRRNPVVASLAGAVLGLLVVIAAGGSVMSLLLNDALGRAQGDRNLARAAEREARLGQAEALVSQAHSSLHSGRMGQRFETLAALERAAALGRELRQPPEWFDKLRDDAVAALALPDWRTVREWDLPPDVRQWSCDERQRLYARIDVQGRVSVRRVDTDEETARLGDFPGENWVGLTPGGRFLLMHGADRRYRAWDLASTPPALVSQESGVCGGTCHPDGRHVVLGRTDGSILLYDLTSAPAAPRLLTKLGDGPATRIALDPRGEKLAVVAANGRVVRVIDVQSGKSVLAPWSPRAPVETLAWHPAGKLLAAAGLDGRVFVADMTRGQEAAVLTGCRSGGVVVAFTPDGEFVVSSGWEGKLRLWHWRTGEQVLSRTGDSHLWFGPDGFLMVREGNRLGVAEPVVGRECRTLVRQSSPGKEMRYGQAAVHPDGRLLAVGMSDGVHLWDLETGDEVAHLGTTVLGGLAFAPDALVTNGPAGLFVWPIPRDRQPDMTWQIGPPRFLSAGTFMNISASADGRLIAQPVPGGALVLHRDHPGRATRLRPQDDVRGTLLSPDGRFVATCSFGGRGGVKVWETECGEVVKELPLGILTHAAFSPDGKWLAVRGREGGRLLTVDTWEERPVPEWREAAFSPDGNVLALETGQGVIRLLDPATGREYARLADPHQNVSSWLGFTPDSTRLVGVSEEGQAIHVWDLRLIRAGLAGLGLDWDAPPYPERADAAPGSLEVRVVGADFPARFMEATGMNDKAWSLVTGPRGRRDPAAALLLMRKAIEVDPDNETFLNTLGTVQYRNGQYGAAVATLEKSLTASQGRIDAFDLFPLAMCHARLGEPAKAKDCFDRAVAWTEAHKDLSPGWAMDLKALRAEAQALLADPN